MTCERQPTAGKLIPVHLRVRGGPGLVVARINPERAILAVPVRPEHYVTKCWSWSFDLTTWRFYRKSFSLLHVHMWPHGRTDGFIYAIAAGRFERMGHSSYICTDTKRREKERWHCPKVAFIYDARIEEQYWPSSAPVPVAQGVLL